MGYCPCSNKENRLTANKLSVWCLKYSKFDTGVSENKMVDSPIATSLLSLSYVFAHHCDRDSAERDGQSKGNSDLHGWAAEREGQGSKGTTDEVLGITGKQGLLSAGPDW